MNSRTHNVYLFYNTYTHTNTMSKCYYTISILKLAFYINKIGHNIIIQNINALYVFVHHALQFLYEVIQMKFSHLGFSNISKYSYVDHV